jgi:hypothetical protein
LQTQTLFKFEIRGNGGYIIRKINQHSGDGIMKKNLLLVMVIGLLLPVKVFAWKSLDYSHPSNWVICEKTIRKNCEVDVFYVLPTIYSDKNNAYMLWYDNQALQKKALMIATQHTDIFSGYSRVFAPYYRQAEFRRAMKEIYLPVEKQTFIQHGIHDVRNAFQYYMKHLNKGRPFILLGFSQGSVALLEIMKTELADPKVNAKLVAAYLIGYPNMPKTFPKYPHLRTAQRADDTGVIINYNSQAPGKVKSPFSGKSGVYCINPVNWRTDDKIADFAEHKGSRFFDFKSGKATDKKAFVSAKIDPASGGLIVQTATPGKYDSRVLGSGVYHMFDLNLFYYDLRANGKQRIQAFWK